MADGKLDCPRCGKKDVEVVWLANRLVYRPHNDPRDGARCPKGGKPASG